jgi:hypothetical protein
VWIEVVRTATIMSPVSIAAHNGVRSPSVRPPRTRIRPWRRIALLRAGMGRVCGP